MPVAAASLPADSKAPMPAQQAATPMSPPGNSGRGPGPIRGVGGISGSCRASTGGRLEGAPAVAPISPTRGSASPATSRRFA